MNGQTAVRSPTTLRLNKVLWLCLAVFIGFWALVFLRILDLATHRFGPQALWASTACAFLLVLALAGRGVNGQWHGVLIDTRNKLSLSRLQITLWTVLILSAFFTIAVVRLFLLKVDPEKAIDIDFPGELMAAMGISAASFAGSALIKSNKRTKTVRIDVKLTPESGAGRLAQAEKELLETKSELEKTVKEQAERERAQAAAAGAFTAATTAAANASKAVEAQPQDAALQTAKLNADAARTAAFAELQKAETLLKTKKLDVEANVVKQADGEQRVKALKDELDAITKAQGLLHRNDDPCEASWIDLFRGEEIANYKLVDMAKVQMLLFTLVVLIAYTATLLTMFREEGRLARVELAFPSFSDTLNGLLAISHGTYLSVKTIDHE